MLDIHSFSKDGLLEIVDTRKVDDYHAHVTVRETIGGVDSWNLNKRALENRMRRLAIKCVSDPITTTIDNRFTDVCYHVTFCIVHKGE